MKILYASETGNSSDAAERVWRKAKRMGIPAKIMNICDYVVAQLIEEQLVIFVCSTTGQGECPSDMQKFWKFLLRKNLPKDSLSSLSYGVVAMGDSSYDRYNVVGKRLHKRLEQLGGEPLFPVVLCDDQHELGYDAALEPWLQDFSSKILPVCYPNCSRQLDEDDLLPPKYRIDFLSESNNISLDVLTITQNGLSDTMAEVIHNSRVTAIDHFQAVHLIKLSIDSKVTFSPGDVVVLMPKNDPENVDCFSSLFNAPLDAEFVLSATDPETPLPKNLPMPCTLRHCISAYWDIQGIPRRSFFDIMWHFSKCDLEKEKLKEFTTAEGQEELYAYCNRPRRSTLEVLQDFPNTTPHIPIDYLFDLIPPIRPRSFSIASSLSYHPNEIHLLVAVVRYKTKLHKPRIGLCSTWLSRLNTGSRIPYTLKQGSIRLPPSFDIPLLMVGPGTGCAAFRAFVQERCMKGVKENYLFFGCRYKDKDFLCQEEWLAFVNQGALKLFTAFSRDQDYKIYVQHRMLEEKELIWDLIQNKGAHTYISGNSKNMPTDVKNALVDIFVSEGNMDENSARNYLQALETSHRLTTETWS